MSKILYSIELYNENYKNNASPELILNIENCIYGFIKNKEYTRKKYLKIKDSEIINNRYMPLPSNYISICNSIIFISKDYNHNNEITIISNIKYVSNIILKYKLNGTIETTTLENLILLNKLNGEMTITDRIPYCMDDIDGIIDTSSYKLDNYDNIKNLSFTVSDIEDKEIKLRLVLN